MANFKVLNSNIYWIPFRGYFVNIDMKCYHLRDACINFYDENGNTYPVSLDYGCGFTMPFKNIDFHVRKSVNFTGNEVVIIKHKKTNKYDENNNASLYVPLKALDVTISTDFEEEHGNMIYTFCEVAFKGEFFRTFGNQNHPNIIVGVNKDRLYFKMFKTSRYTEEFINVQKLAREIERECEIRIDSYILQKILKHYTIKKKKV